MAKITVLQEALLSSGNTDDVESTGDISVSGASKTIRVRSNKGVAAAGSTQGNATQLTDFFSVITSGGSGAGVVLPSIVPAGATAVVANWGTNTYKVYPPPGQIFLGSQVNQEFSLGLSTVMQFYGIDSYLWAVSRVAR